MGLGTEIALIKALGGALPPITAADAGKVLTANDSGVWGAQNPIGEPFIVTLTPTAPDYSGTMDRTVSEINAAYEAGQEIVFKVITAVDAFVEIPCSAVGHYDHTGYYPNFMANIIQYTSNVIIVANTGDTNDGTKQTYSTKVYTLTPAT